MITTVEITIDIVKANWITENGAHGSHWEKARKRRNLKQLAYVRALQAARGVRFKRAHVTAYVQYPSNNRADPNNAEPSSKPIIDGFTQAGLWADDDNLHVVGPDFRREPGKTGTKGLHRIRYVIEEMPLTSRNARYAIGPHTARTDAHMPFQNAIPARRTRIKSNAENE
jgi:crossover junction endodeoxyribonuclease RusA